ncbi:hypothetical protein D3C72_1855860 [compost metagenome]
MATTEKRRLAFSLSVKSALPCNRAWPPNALTCSGATVSTWSARPILDGASSTAISPCVKLPCRLAWPPLPSAWKSSAIGVLVPASMPGTSSARSSCLLRALAFHTGSVRPSNTRLACSGAGALPATATSMWPRSPRATRPSRAGVRPSGAGSSALMVMSVS